MNISHRRWHRSTRRWTQLTAGAGVACVVAVAAVVSSGTALAKNHAASTKKIRIGLVTINETAAFFTEMNAGAQSEARKLHVNLVISNPDNSVSTQNSDVEDDVATHMNAVIADSIDGPPIVSAFRYARKHGVKVVAVDAIVHSPTVQAQIGVNNVAAGRNLGIYFVKWAKKHLPGGVGRIGVVGALNSPIQVQRQAGFVNYVKAHGSKILQVVNGQNVEATAQTQAQNLVTANPSMNVIYNTGEPANLGAISAVKQAGKAGKLPIFGWDLDSIGISAIKSGIEIAAVQQNPYQEGVQAVEAAVRLVRGQHVAKNVTAPATVVSRSNVRTVKPY